MTPDQATQLLVNIDALNLAVVEISQYIQLGFGAVVGIVLSWIMWYFLKGALIK